MLIRGDVEEELDELGHTLRGDSLLLLLNGGARSKQFTLPALDGAGKWTELLDTSHERTRNLRDDRVNLAAHSLILLALHRR